MNEIESEPNFWSQLQREHRKLDRVLEDVLALASLRSFSTAGKRFGEFRIAEEFHIRAEEALLGLLERSAKGSRFTGQLRQEHADLLALVEAVSELLSRWDWPILPQKIAQLARLLQKHEADEKLLIFPELESIGEDRTVFRQLLQHLAQS